MKTSTKVLIGIGSVMVLGGIGAIIYFTTRKKDEKEIDPNLKLKSAKEQLEEASADSEAKNETPAPAQQPAQQPAQNSSAKSTTQSTGDPAVKAMQEWICKNGNQDITDIINNHDGCDGKIGDGYKKATQALAELYGAKYGVESSKIMKATIEPKLKMFRGKAGRNTTIEDKFTTWATQIRDAVQGAGTDEKKIEDVFSKINSIDEIDKLEAKFYRLDGKTTLQNAINGDYSKGSADLNKLNNIIHSKGIIYSFIGS